MLGVLANLIEVGPKPTQRATMSSRAPGKLAFVFVLLTVLMDTIGLGIIIPVTPELIMELTGEGLSRAAIFGGWLDVSYAIMQFICAPILGNLSDRFGRRPVLLYSVASLGVDYLMMAMAPTIAPKIAREAVKRRRSQSVPVGPRGCAVGCALAMVAI